MKHNQSGILFVELLMYMLIVAVFAVIAVPRTVYTAKRQATKAEMGRVIGVLQLYEQENETLPNNINTLKPLYFADDDYKKDSWGNNYTYSKANRQLCSTNTDIGCITFD